MIPAPPNVTASIYRGWNSSSPFPAGGTAPAATVSGLLKHHMKNGIRGRAIALFWTHLLYVDESVDIRDAYATQLAGEDPTQADTVVIGSHPVPGECCAFLVVLVQHLPEQQTKRVYLDRVLPIQGPCPGGPQTIAVTCNPCTQMPKRWVLAVGSDFATVPTGCPNCANLNGTRYNLDYQGGGGCLWQSDWFPNPCPADVTGPLMRWQHYLDAFGWRLFLGNLGRSILRYDIIAPAAYHCASVNTFANPVWLNLTCQSTSNQPATITPG